jgi:hypothetical protein
MAAGIEQFDWTALGARHELFQNPNFLFRRALLLLYS